MDFDAYERQMLALINTHGVAIQGVGGEGEHPPFQYTVGLAAHEHPEFIAFGLPMEVGESILNHIASTVLSKTHTYAHGDVVDDLVRGYPVRLIEVMDTREHLTMSNRIYGLSASIRALQIVFPDAQGRWPWEPESGMSSLPLLGPVPSEDEGNHQALDS